MESDGSDVITYYLEMTSAEQLRPARPPAQPFAVRRAELAFPALNRFFYAEVGRAYSWTNRMHWTDAQWLAWLERPGMQTWIGYVRETPAGYFELDEQRAMRNSQEAGSSLISGFSKCAADAVAKAFDRRDGRSRTGLFGSAAVLYWPGSGGRTVDRGDSPCLGTRPAAGLAPHLYAGPPGGVAQLSEERFSHL